MANCSVIEMHAEEPAQADRRQAKRVRPGPLKVRLHRLCQGTLIDISEAGALVWLPIEQVPDKQVTLQVEWKGETVHLPARIVRVVSHYSAERLRARQAARA